MLRKQLEVTKLHSGVGVETTELRELQVKGMVALKMESTI